MSHKKWQLPSTGKYLKNTGLSSVMPYPVLQSSLVQNGCDILPLQNSTMLSSHFTRGNGLYKMLSKGEPGPAIGSSLNVGTAKYLNEIHLVDPKGSSSGLLLSKHLN